MPNDPSNNRVPYEPDAAMESRLVQFAGSFPYPPTPDIAMGIRQRLEIGAPNRRRVFRPGGMPRKALLRIGWALAAAALLMALLIDTPVRARVVELLRIGAVRIFMEPQPTPPATGQPTSLIDLAGETTLEKAADLAGFPIMLPKYPPDLAEPQHVYVQRTNGTSAVISVWLKDEAPGEVRLALYQIGDGDAFQKQLMRNMEETSVNGAWALWIEGPYLLSSTDGRIQERRIVAGHTLLWSTAGQTFRLETDLPLDEARKMAESLAKWNE